MSLSVQHDPGTAQCSPGFGGGGNYIMFAQATDGTQANNNMFSPCSKERILAVLRSTRSSCFTGESVGVASGCDLSNM